ncbi:flagellar biosynthetic protein FliQ [Rheinheimera aquimaris]|jgi:flagellar biosynthetic protein FliQ|uniref:flagellar biosynthetic protein FliQ n=1 Tax=Rheinheimera aquimaris TaxID=412437 RepID=UPI00106667E7|nr:flagellar biosynthetic protein FliQ [Rheinheimera aquimaris]MCD1600369.1 flagellar biosynthetic protein FliQ [Rheinheimera aquimaris]|tara:strand:+ start:1856 stop:2119 length:264 start_codon:yes stop_codon:yes gene_type:complete
MTEDFVVSLMGHMFYTALKVSLPVLLSTLIAGVLISILQVVTQIQEMTLTFVPKLVIAVAVLGVAGAWMLSTLTEFARQTILGAGLL